VISLLLALALVQQHPAPQVMSAVDRDHVVVGDVVELTVRITSQTPEPVQVSLPPLLGFELVGRSERSEVSYGNAKGRITTVTLQLRATTRGHWRIGKIQIRQGSHLEEAEPVDVYVDRGSAATASALPSRIRRVLEQAPPPRGSPPAAISLVVSDPSVVVGQQVDVVTIAWFQRDLRQQLRRSPTVEAPRIEGVWSYPQQVPTGIAASRLIGGRWYDLFILHQIVFPLTPGTVKVAAARLHYSVPLAFQFFSQEERYSLVSGTSSLDVTPLPTAGRPGDFTGAVARNLTVTDSISPSVAQQGEAVTASLVLRGEGNVALWPVPAVTWPPGFRAYPDATEERVSTTDGRLGGTKTFRYLLVADSAGTTAIPAVRYSYFDPGTGTYASTRMASVSLTVAPRSGGALLRATPPPLILDARPGLAREIRETFFPWVWWLALLIGPLIFAGRVIHLPHRAKRTEPPRADSLAAVERELSRMVAALAAGQDRNGPESLQASLRRSGLSEPDAQKVIEVRERLRAARFGGSGIDPTVLAEARALILRIRPERPRSGPRWRSGTAAMLLFACASTLRGQSTSPEQLYEAGALGSAAAGFQARVQAAPEVGAYWYNLGAARFRLGEDAAALGAWTRAARLLPRNRNVQRALVLVPAANGASASELAVSPLTPDELWLIGFIVWTLGWAGLAVSRRVRGRWLIMLGCAATFIGAAEGLRWWYARPVAVVINEGAMLVSPSERAPRVTTLPKETSVLVRETRAGWALVEDGSGHRGWTERSGLIPLAGKY
jgi:hypothetical protein